MTAKTFFIIEASSVYGARVFISPEHSSQCNSLAQLCKWGGHDKVFNELWGFEFSDHMFGEVCHLLQASGFRRVDWS